MSDFKLASPRQAEDALARLFLDEGPVRLCVREDKAFASDRWLDFGEIAVFSVGKRKDELKAAVRAGSFEWRVPARDVTENELRSLLSFDALTTAPKKAAAESRLSGAVQSMAGIAVRAGLSWPRFDPKLLSEMPFRRPTTVVADTSGVIQGALGFVADYLYPTARLKIPAVLHMEVINQADRFMKAWRTATVRGEILLSEHLRSQPGQRALVRLELREDTEVERNPLLGDPLRSAFKEDKDPDLRDLNLSIPLKSYVDRMILEVARTHQSYASHGHEVLLLTADQGLAKMALAEGVRPLFFRALDPAQLFGKTLTGTLLHPFSGRLVTRPLAGLLWELATAFGRVKIVQSEQQHIEIASIGKDLGWSSYHSVDDLLWLRVTNVPAWPVEPAEASLTSSEDDLLMDDRGVEAEAQTNSNDAVSPDDLEARKKPKKVLKPRPERKTRLATTNEAGVAFYRLNANALVMLVEQLSAGPKLSDEEVTATIGVRHPAGVAEYRRFLLSGGFIAPDEEEWVATDALLALATAQRECDLERVRDALCRAPSYARFVELLGQSFSKGPVDLKMPPRVTPTYIALGEVTGIGASIAGEGYYPTLARPSVAEFAERAITRYAELDPADGWVAVGEWLEALIRTDGIHPIVARNLLQEADAANFLRRSTEGSTMNTRFDDHTLRVLQAGNGKVGVETVHLYRGDFLIPGKSSSSLRLQRAS